MMRRSMPIRWSRIVAFLYSARSGRSTGAFGSFGPKNARFGSFGPSVNSAIRALMRALASFATCTSPMSVLRFTLLSSACGR